MNTSLAKHLWQSPVVRDVMKKEAMRLLWFITFYVAGTALSRYIREKPIFEGILSAAVGAAAITLMWAISVVRTFRAVLRENNLLGR